MAVIGGDDSPRACARGFQGMLLAVRVTCQASNEVQPRILFDGRISRIRISGARREQN